EERVAAVVTAAGKDDNRRPIDAASVTQQQLSTRRCQCGRGPQHEIARWYSPENCLLSSADLFDRVDAAHQLRRPLVASRFMTRRPQPPRQCLRHGSTTDEVSPRPATRHV